jgi:hypothetical protein
MRSTERAGIWNFYRYNASNPSDQIHARIKTLQDPRANDQNETMQDNARKSKLLYNVFFRPPVNNDHVDPEFEYMPPICEFKPIPLLTSPAPYFHHHISAHWTQFPAPQTSCHTFRLVPRPWDFVFLA